MRQIFNTLIKELGYDEGKSVFEWYCETYGVTIEDDAPATVKREVFGDATDTTKAHDYIMALTSKGGDHYTEYERFDTPEHREAFEKWLEEQPKVAGVALYRGYTFERGYWEDGLWLLESGEASVDNLTAGQDVPAFTLSPLRAANYINEFGNGKGFEDSVRVHFTVKTRGLYCVDIAPFSYYKSEYEHRCTRDARFVVESMIDKGFFWAVTLREVK